MTARPLTIRFAVAKDRKIASAMWRIWKSKNNDNIYIAVRSIAGLAKITLHANGYCHFALTSQYWESGQTDRPQRTIVNWTRERVLPNNAKGVVAIFIPFDFLAPSSQVIDAETLVIEAPTPGNAIIIQAFYATFPYGEMPKPNGAIELGYVALSNGEHFVVLGGIIPFDATEFKRTNKLDQPLPINLTSPDILEADRMIVVNDPAKDEMLKLVDVGGITITKIHQD